MSGNFGILVSLMTLIELMCRCRIIEITDQEIHFVKHKVRDYVSSVGYKEMGAYRKHTASHGDNTFSEFMSTE